MSSDTPISTQAQVVLIDDDPHLRGALSQTLDTAGLKVASLGDARDGRTPAGGLAGVVVSDIRMPGIDGLELLQQLRARDSELPVILITGHGDIQLAVQAMRAGAYDFLEKPFPSEALLDSVRRALALRQLVLDNRSLRGPGRPPAAVGTPARSVGRCCACASRSAHWPEPRPTC